MNALRWCVKFAFVVFVSIFVAGISSLMFDFWQDQPEGRPPAGIILVVLSTTGLAATRLVVVIVDQQKECSRCILEMTAYFLLLALVWHAFFFLTGSTVTIAGYSIDKISAVSGLVGLVFWAFLLGQRFLESLKALEDRDVDYEEG